MFHHLTPRQAKSALSRKSTIVNNNITDFIMTVLNYTHILYFISGFKITNDIIYEINQIKCL